MDHMQHKAIISTMKHLIKNRGYRYKDIASHLNVSLVTVKRVFSCEDCNISRLMEICNFLGTTFFDVVDLAKYEYAKPYFLSSIQEEYFSENPLSFGIFRLLQRGNEAEEVRKKFGISLSSWLPLIKDLEELSLIERHPKNRMHIIAKGQLRWSLKGPLAKKILPAQNKQFLEHVFKNIESEELCYMVQEGFFSKESLKEMISDFQALGRKFRHRASQEEKLLGSDQLLSARYLVAISPFQTDWQSL